MNRRSLLRLAVGSVGAWPAGAALAQGVSTHKTKPVPRRALSGRPFHARLTDVASAAGLREPVVYGPVDTKQYIVETIGCGCAFFDYDNDGWMDVFILGGTRRDGDPPAAGNRLYKNNRDGTFTDVTAKAGLLATGWASAVCVGDYDNDGFEDLFCTAFGQNRLYRNNGDGTFTDVTKAAGLSTPDTRWGAGCSFVDYNRDGHLDLFVANYIRFSFERAPVPGANSNCNWKGVPVACGPRGLPHGRPALYRNNGDGTFTDVTEASGVAAAPPGYGMTVVAADFDEDGWPDIYVACDSTPSLLFMNNRDGTFREEGVLRGVALSEDGGEQAGMGVGIGDYDRDGHLDLLKTHFADDASGLYHNDGTGQFDDVTRRARVAVETRYVGWGAGIVDLDNDGHPDLFVVTGNVYPEVERTLPQYPNATPRAVFRNLGDGTFEQLVEEAGPGVAAAHCSRGCAFGDFDNDGDLDVLIVNLNAPPSLLRNDVTGSNGWIKVKLEGVVSNRSAIGARVVIHAGGSRTAQAVVSQSSFYSANDPRLHFGMGRNRLADIEVFWPNGRFDRFKGLAANQLVTIKEGVGVIPSRGWPAK
jgi:enediyne biosynthesis protein E4